MKLAIDAQDRERKNYRLMSELMHRATCATNFNDGDTDLQLPGDTTTLEIVSEAATRALGFAPQITPQSVILLKCAHSSGDCSDFAYDLEDPAQNWNASD